MKVKFSSLFKIDRENLNFIIAIVAMLISIASFYATYLQANAADQQVKAMTYPLLQSSSSNFDTEQKVSKIILELINNGVGPAILKKVDFIYQQKHYSNIYQFLNACCEAEMTEFNTPENRKNVAMESQLIISTPSGQILAANDIITMLSLKRDPANLNLWEKLNKVRFKLTVSACYCSLLDACYQTEQVGEVKPVAFCP